MPQSSNAAPERRTSPSDGELVSLARGGSAAAFGEIMQRNNARLFRVLRGVLKDDSDAEDALQETYVRAFTNLDGYAGAAALSTWLTRIALNEALSRLRRRRTTVAFEDIPESAGGTAGAASDSGRVIPFRLAQAVESGPEHAAARAEIRRLLEHAIDELPEPFRVAFVLRFVEQMSVAETASFLGVPEETVKTRVHRARRRLRDALEERLASALATAFPFAGARCARLSAAVLRRLGVADPPRGSA
jgi:RNA polymerase sigma-70 factor (ECF subfamily)